MKSLELKNTELAEMNSLELKEHNGGLLEYSLLDLIVDVIRGSFTIWV